MVGVARGRLGKFNLFEPDPDGALTFLSAVRVDPWHPLSIETPVADAAVRHGDIVDIVAWHPDHPGRWALRLGNALHLGLIEPQYLDPEAVRVHRGPLGWLRARCRGLVLLTHDPRDQYRILTICRAIIAEDPEHKRALHASLARALPLPLIDIGQQGDHLDVAA
jgi:hypothetical protein